MAKVAFLGLGVMGFPMAGHLAKAGHEVTVYNRTAAKSQAWVEKHKGRIFFETEPGRGTTFYVRLPRHGFDPGAGLSDDDAGVLAGRGAEERR